MHLKNEIICFFYNNIGEQYDEKPIYYTFNQHEKQYKGNGIYGDRPIFHWDYYNVFVIHPMILDISQIMIKYEKIKEKNVKKYLKKSIRYASFLESLISLEGTNQLDVHLHILQVLFIY